MSSTSFTKGLHEIGPGAYAYLQPDGSWGWSNSGLIVDGDESLLVDTLFDEKLTAEMLAIMKDATGISSGDIATLINTHANGDHTFGNHLVENAEIIASEASLREMEALGPDGLQALMEAAPEMGLAGQYFAKSFAGFEFDKVQYTLPTKTFSGDLQVNVGDKAVRLIEVGPAHTEGDVLVHVPDDKTVFTGDILFIDSTPLMWAGPVSNWIKACDLICDMDVDTIVPGHGPITDKAGVGKVKEYLSFINKEARARYDAGMSRDDAIKDIALGEYRHWLDSERIAINVDTLYREFSGTTTAPNVVELFGLMATLARDE